MEKMEGEDEFFSESCNHTNNWSISEHSIFSGEVDKRKGLMQTGGKPVISFTHSSDSVSSHHGVKHKRPFLASDGSHRRVNMNWRLFGGIGWVCDLFSMPLWNLWNSSRWQCFRPVPVVPIVSVIRVSKKWKWEVSVLNYALTDVTEYFDTYF